MDKKILITGKRNIDSFSNKKKKRLESEKWQNKELLLDNKKQINILNKLYLNEKYQGCDNVKSAIVKKIKGYENQDIKKNKLNQRKLIKYEDLLEILVISKLKCYYCKCDCLLMYDNVREKKQWTLDRLNNDEGHNRDNVVVSCLECNVKKGTIDDKKFRFAKQMRIIKKC
jgi:5-methylcytosine-specific restriction endonuclease McrA|uniref:HNH nuclease domain-containing protein n=1 Tax=viral metagenome TaxID=1070528 RepID=A0A6C0IPT9_9ZZZZ